MLIWKFIYRFILNDIVSDMQQVQFKSMQAWLVIVYIELIYYKEVSAAEGRGTLDARSGIGASRAPLLGLNCKIKHENGTKLIVFTSSNELENNMGGKCWPSPLLADICASAECFSILVLSLWSGIRGKQVSHLKWTQELLWRAYARGCE